MALKEETGAIETPDNFEQTLSDLVKASGRKPEEITASEIISAAKARKDAPKQKTIKEAYSKVWDDRLRSQNEANTLKDNPSEPVQGLGKPFQTKAEPLLAGLGINDIQQQEQILNQQALQAEENLNRQVTDKAYGAMKDVIEKSPDGKGLIKSLDGLNLIQTTRAAADIGAGNILNDEIKRLDVINQEIESKQIEMADRQAVRQQQADKMLNDINKFYTDMSTRKIDMNRFTGNMGTFQKIGTVISAAIGGALAARTGGTNETLNRLDKYIQQDIELQKEQLNRGGEAKMNLYKAMLAKFGDERSAEEATKALMMAKTKNVIDVAQLKISDVNAKRQLEQMKAQLDLQTASLMLSASAKQGQRIRPIGAVVDPKTLNEKERGLYFPLTGQLVATPQDKVKVQTMFENAQKATSLIDEALEIKNSASGGRTPFSASRAKLKSIEADLQTLMTGQQGLGAISEGDKKILDNMISGGGILNFFGVTPTLIRLKQRISGGLNNRFQEFGLSGGAAVNKLSQKNQTDDFVNSINGFKEF